MWATDFQVLRTTRKTDKRGNVVKVYTCITRPGFYADRVFRLEA